MSDQIAPIQRDAAGATTFEKVQTYEVKTPDTGAPPPKAAKANGTDCAASSDNVNFSKPMKTFIESKKSYFTAPPPPSEVQKQKRKQDEQRPAPEGQALMPNQNPTSLFQVFG